MYDLKSHSRRIFWSIDNYNTSLHSSFYQIQQETRALTHPLNVPIFFYQTLDTTATEFTTKEKKNISGFVVALVVYG